MPRTGVFVCHCGSNIAGKVDVETVAAKALNFDRVVFSTTYKYMCSQPGQEVIKKAVRDNNLDRIVVAACTPNLHGKTFQRCIKTVGLSPYLSEMASIREHCSWVHTDPDEATGKAIELVRLATAKVRKNVALLPLNIPVTRRALVIGGGIAGIQSALDIAAAGFEAVIVEKEPSVGGRMAQLDKTFPTLDCSACILAPRMVEVATNEKVIIHSYSKIEKITGSVGSFEVQIKKKARYVDLGKCTGCGTCTEKCPVKVDSEFNLRLSTRKAISTPFPQAVPNVPVIDPHHCRYLTLGKCGVCQKVCQAGAVNYEDKDEIIIEKVGAIIAATGYDLFDPKKYGEYGGGRYRDVITGLQFERLINASGPTGGEITRLSDGKTPKTIVFIQCVGSRDEQKGKPYCSKICCMYTAKQTILAKEHIPDVQCYVFYIDIRAGGKNYEEFVKRAQTDYGAVYIRGRVSKLYEQEGQIMVKGMDTLLGEEVEIPADLVVLATAIVPRREARTLAQKIGLSYDQHAFYNEAHPKMAPVENLTLGIYLAGACQAPKDIPDSVAMASAAAAKICGLFSRDFLSIDPIVASVAETCCVGCNTCVAICPFKAISMEIRKDRTGQERQVATVNTSLCQGCGTCLPNCRSRCISLNNWTTDQLYAEVMTI